MEGADRSSIDRRTVLKLTGASAAAAGLSSLAGCISDESPDTFVVSMGEVAETADPNDHNATPDYNTLDPVYEPLFDVTEEGEIQEHVVTEWEQPDDETIELTIRDDVVFHNGDELTASDVAYTINRQNDGEVGIGSPQADGLIGVTGAEAVDDYTVEVSHEVSPVLAEMGLAVFARAVNEDWMEDREQPVTDDMNGTGPFELEEMDPGESFVYTPFDDYWGETPDVEEIRIESINEDGTRVSELQTGGSDLISNVPPGDVAEIDEDDDLEIRNVTSYRNIFLVMPNDDGPFDSQEFRQAMNYAVDNEEIVDSVNDGFGETMSQPIPDGIFGHNPDLDPYPYDPDEAESLIEESGYDGEEITLHCPEGRYLNDTDIAEFAAEQIDQLDNVDCSAEIIDFSELTEAALDGDMSTSHDFFLIGWNNPTHDPNYGLEPWFVSGEATNHFDDEEIEDLILESQTIEDEDEREQQIQEINELIHDRAAWVFLHNQESIYGIREDVEWEPRADERIDVAQL